MKIYTRGIVRRAVALALTLALLLGVSPVPSVRAADQVVTNTNDSGSGSLRQAIADAGDGETITFNLATYPATITLTSGELHIDKSLTIIGPGADQLTIDGNDASRVFYITFCSEPSCTVTVEISGLTIANGLASGTEDSNKIGGGIFNQFGSLTLTDAIFNNNTASSDGGGMYNDTFASPILTDVIFSENTASENGGGMYNDIDSPPTLTNVTFSNNAANNGGGMYNYHSSPDLTDVTFSDNTAASGGGMYNNIDSHPTLTHVTFSGNAANIASGGGIVNENGSSPTLTDVTFSGNTADNDGGGMHNTDSSPVLTQVTFSSNTAGRGGGMYNNYTAMTSNTCTPSLTNVTFSGNAADNGGGIYNYRSSPVLTNVTFSGNTADDGSGSGDGGGMYNLLDSSPTLENVILWGNNSAGTSGNEIFNNDLPDYPANPTITDSVIAGGCPTTGSPTCTNIITTNPNLGALADNGGATQTIALGAGSSAIDAGGANTTCASTDQRGAARPYGSGCDIGAYEARESIAVGTCGGAALNGLQTFSFAASGNTVTVDVDSSDGISCMTVEEMGPGASHPMATGPGTSGVALLTGNWWHITGDVTSGFNVDITLPYSGADTDSRVCRWPGGLGGFGWDCGDGANTSFGTGTVTRTGVDRFSDWAVGDQVGPTVVTLTTFAVEDALWLPVGLLVLSAAGLMLVRKRRYSDFGAR